jgi:hypothetical protein
MERDSQYSKKQSGGEAVPTAKASPTRGLNGLLETVRQKMAYTIRGI